MNLSDAVEILKSLFKHGYLCGSGPVTGSSSDQCNRGRFLRPPVIATRRGGLPEVVEHETNGLLVEAERPAELADAMCRLINDPQLRHRLAINARRCATERFGRESFLNEFLALLGTTE